MQKTAFKLIGEFYVMLWGQLDDLSDEHRWVKLVGELKVTRTVADILSELQNLVEEERMMDLKVLRKDLKDLTQFVEKFKKEWGKASTAERDVLRKSLEEKRSVFQERGLAFMTCQTCQTATKSREKKIARVSTR